MKLTIFPTWQELMQHKERVPEINPAAILVMLRIMQASEVIHSDIQDVLEKKHHLSEGKLRVMILLHQNPKGVTPSLLAAKAGVTKATISVMTRRMLRDGLVDVGEDPTDRRGKIFTLTEAGRAMMDQILPTHYLRISRVMGKLSEQEQKELISLLEKLST